jgi:hypothetical protein
VTSSRLWKKKERTLGEVEREDKKESGNPATPPDSFLPSLGLALPDLPRRDVYMRARKLFGHRSVSIIAKAEQRGMPPDEIHGCIDTVINEDGGVDYFAHLLLDGGE